MSGLWGIKNPDRSIEQELWCIWENSYECSSLDAGEEIVPVTIVETSELEALRKCATLLQGIVNFEEERRNEGLHRYTIFSQAEVARTVLAALSRPPQPEEEK